MTRTTTPRGFVVYEFTDRYGDGASLQESSLGSEAAIWLGSDGRIRVFTPYGNPPWREVTHKDVAAAMGGESALVNARVHLTQEHVRDLLPLLQFFVEHGHLP